MWGENWLKLGKVNLAKKFKFFKIIFIKIFLAKIKVFHPTQFSLNSIYVCSSTDSDFSKKNIFINWCNSTENWLNILYVLSLSLVASSGHLLPIEQFIVERFTSLFVASAYCCYPWTQVGGRYEQQSFHWDSREKKSVVVNIHYWNWPPSRLTK